MRYGSVCSGVEAATLAWKSLGWKCVFVSEVEPFPCAVLQERFGASAPIHPLDPEEASDEKDRKMREKWLRELEYLKKEGDLPNEGDFTKIGNKYAGKYDLLVGGTPCFVAGTMVLTPSGYVPIETLKVGDTIISGEGLERKVEAVGCKGANVGRIKIVGRPEIFCTDNHPFMCFDVKRDNRRKSPTYSQYIPVNDYHKVPATEAVGKYVGRVKVTPVAAPALPEVYDASAEQIIELAGWYLGDGYIRRWSGSNKKAVVFALCNQQKIDTFGERFGDALNYSISNDGKVTVACTALANWLSEQFGELSGNKRIPYWCYGEEYKYALLRGYRSTDGCEQEKEYKFTTVSKALAYGMADLMGDASVTFTKTADTAVIEGRTINQKDWYCVHFYKNSTVRTKKFNGRYASKIRSFIHAGIDVVYNITVAEDHTYIANGIYVHNCQDLSVAGKRAGFDGERSSLALDFVRLAYESKCKYFVWENVPGVFSSNNGNDFATLLSLFTGSEVAVPCDGWGTAGFVCNARRDRYGVSWRTLDGQFTRSSEFPFAVPQRRRRVFLVGYLGDWRRAAEILLEPECSCWHTPSRFRTREILAGTSGKDLALADGKLRLAGQSGADRHWDASGCNPTLNQCNAGSGIIGASNQELFSQNFNGLVTSLGESGKGFYNEQASAQTLESHEDQHRRNIIAVSIGNGQVAGLVNEPEVAQTLNCMHDQQAVLRMIENAIGCDMYNTSLTGAVSKTLNSAASDADHVPTCITPLGDDLNDTLDASYYKGVGSRNGNEQIVCGAFLGTQGSKAMGIGYSEEHSPTLRAGSEVDLVQTLKIRSGKEGGGKGALVQDNISATLGCGNDQTLFIRSSEVISMHNKQFGTCEENIASTLLSTDYKEPQVVCYENHANDSRITESNEVSPLLSSRAGTGGGNLPLVQECYAIDSVHSNSMKSANPHSGFHKEEIAKTLDTTDPNPTKNQGGNVIVDAVAIAENIIGRADDQGGNGVGAQEELAYTQNATGVMGVCTKGIASTVRRLLPIETERLMGFPDNHTKIAWKDKSADECPDSPRYKACGNSMCVNVMQWIGEQIERVERKYTNEQ